MVKPPPPATAHSFSSRTVHLSVLTTHHYRFHPWFRGKVQAALTETWAMAMPPLQPISPANHVSRILEAELDEAQLSEYVFVDFCAGGGGPTPSIERYFNEGVSEDGSWGGQRWVGAGGHKQDTTKQRKTATTMTTTPTTTKKKRTKPVHFVLTDLHPHIHNWAHAASSSPNMHYAPQSIDAANAPADLLSTIEPPLFPPPSPTNPLKTFRTFHLAFHHFPDALASRILHNTMATSSGFAIFELQDRHLSSFLSVCLLGLGVMVFSPLFAWRWRSPGTLFWSWVIPILPFVLVWDGWMSSVRTRTVEEIQEMMRTCGADEAEVTRWRVRSGRVTHLPPFAEINWIIATKDEC